MLLSHYFQIQQSIRKLAESIQTVKTVLGMKITSETKLVGDGFWMQMRKLSVIKFICNDILYSSYTIFTLSKMISVRLDISMG